MVFKSPGDVFITVFNFPVYYYGITMALACLVGVCVAYVVFKRYNPDKNYDLIWDFSVWLLIAGILGARLYYCLLNPDYYLSFPHQILNIRQGGLSIHGAVLGGVLALSVAAKRYKLPLLNLLDAFACGTSLAQAVGRWGNFFNSEAFGFPTDLPWKLFIAPSHRPLQYMNFEYFHPTFLYESLLDVCLFIFLFFYMKKFAQTKPGTAFCMYLILYSIIRLFVESFRIDSALDILGVPIAKIVSVFLILVSSILFLIVFKISKKA